MFFRKKNKFIIYTNEKPVIGNPIEIKGNIYHFSLDGVLEVELKSGVYTLTTMGRELTYSFIDPNHIYFISKEDNDCHYNLILKDISKEEYEKLKK